MIIVYFSIFAVIGLLLLNFLYRRTNHYNNQFVDARKFWKSANRECGLQIVNLGSNHPKFGLDYADTGVKGENWAVGPQTLEYDFAILRNNLDRLAPGATVIIPICLLKMFLFRQKSRSVHQKYYTFLPKEDIVDYSTWEKFCNIIFPVINPHRWLYVIRDVKKDERFDLTSNPMTTKEQLEKDADMWIDIWDREFDIILPEPTLSEENLDDIRNNVRILREMLEFCASRGLKPVLTLLPVTETLSSRFSSSFIANHILRYLDEANAVNARVLNYLKDPRYTDSSLYINSFFMNSVGRHQLTKQVLTDLGLISSNL